MEIIYRVRIEPEDTPVRGNACATGDETADIDTENWILSQLERGNLAAWCMAIVTAEVQSGGQTFRGEAALGCCSYKSERECEQEMLSDEYGLKADAREHLEETLIDASRRGHAAGVALAMLKGVL